jgi:hypothetical protein
MHYNTVVNSALLERCDQYHCSVQCQVDSSWTFNGDTRTVTDN